MAKAGDKKLIVILLVVFIVAFGVIAALCYYRWNDNKRLRQDIDGVENRIKIEEGRVALIQGLRQARSQRIEAVNELTKILPTEMETSHQEFLRLLRNFAAESGVVVKSLLPPSEIIDKPMRIKRYKYNILVDGTFPQFVRFLNQIERHTRFLKVDSFDVANANTGVGYWPETPEKRIKLQITTYTYNPLD